MTDLTFDSLERTLRVTTQFACGYLYQGGKGDDEIRRAVSAAIMAAIDGRDLPGDLRGLHAYTDHYRSLLDKPGVDRTNQFAQESWYSTVMAEVEACRRRAGSGERSGSSR